MTKPSTHLLFGLPIWTAGAASALTKFEHLITKSTGKSHVVVTPNPNHIVNLADNEPLKGIYRTADFFMPDGIFLVKTANIILKPHRVERVTGAGLFPEICARLAHLSRAKACVGKLLIIGGIPGRAAEVETQVEAQFNGLDCRVITPAFGFDPKGQEAKLIAQKARDFRPDVTFVCLGFPKQELWALTHREYLDQSLVLCVGAALDFFMGYVKRAPKFYQDHGLEWFWRFSTSRRNMWRILREDIRFPMVAAKEIATSRK